MQPSEIDWVIRNVLLAVGALGTMCAWRYLLLPTLVDEFRQKVFALRRELFLLMADHRLPYSEPAYTRLRATMNAQLRYAERLTMGRLLVSALVSRSAAKEYRARQLQDIDAITNHEVRLAIEDIRQRLSIAIAIHLVLASPIGWLIGASLIAWGVGSRLGRSVQGLTATIRIQFFRLPVEILEEQAEVLTEASPAAAA